MGFPGGSDGKESTCDAGNLGSIPELGRSPKGGHGNSLQYSCLENPTNRGAWRPQSIGLQRGGRNWSDWEHTRRADYQCCGSCGWTAKGLSHTYAPMHSPPDSSSINLPHNMEQSSLCCTGGPCCLSILNRADIISQLLLSSYLPAPATVSPFSKSPQRLF